MTKQITYLTPVNDHFTSQYISVREKEGRVLTDEEVMLLPNTTSKNPHKKEWKIRKKTAERFHNYLLKFSKLNILDLGCGNGWFSNFMTINNNTVIGMDINHSELKQAARVFSNNKNLHFYYADIFKLNSDFKIKFDIITLNASIQYFKDFKLTVDTLKSFLKENGEIHILDSPFYLDNEITAAKNRTEHYYNSLMKPKMAQHYFHHLYSELSNFEVLYQPKNNSILKTFGIYDSPFIWAKYHHNKISSVEKGFSKIAHKYEQLDKTSELVNWMRSRVRTNISSNLNKDDTILEINCGSGIDAVFFAKKNHTIHATDIAEGMIEHVKSKIKSENLGEKLTCEVLSVQKLHQLENQRFDHIFSNFGGLNCVTESDLKMVFNSFEKLLKPNGKITLVIMPKICFWELLKILKGKKNAFRRLKKDGVFANIEGEKVKTYYYSSKKIKKMLNNNFKNFNIENISFLGPTGNHHFFPKKYPLLFKMVKKIDYLSNMIPFLGGFGDYYILNAQKKN